MPTSETTPSTYRHGVYPDARGRYGDFGGRFVPESLMAALAELELAYDAARADADFAATLADFERTYTGRPTPLYLARRLSERVGACVYLKREDLAHTGAHKINNALGQGLLAERMGKRRIIPRPARASMASPRPLSAPGRDSNASSIWARRISAASRSTSFA